KQKKSYSWLIVVVSYNKNHKQNFETFQESFKPQNHYIEHADGQRQQVCQVSPDQLALRQVQMMITICCMRYLDKDTLMQLQARCHQVQTTEETLRQ
ncbi:hypothetical protein SK128_000910, partial [Halocaridina rubra]